MKRTPETIVTSYGRALRDRLFTHRLLRPLQIENVSYQAGDFVELDGLQAAQYERAGIAERYGTREPIAVKTHRQVRDELRGAISKPARGLR